MAVRRSIQAWTVCRKEPGMAVRRSIQAWTVCRKEPRMAVRRSIQGWTVCRKEPRMAVRRSIQGRTVCRKEPGMAVQRSGCYAEALMSGSSYSLMGAVLLAVTGACYKLFSSYPERTGKCPMARTPPGQDVLLQLRSPALVNGCGQGSFLTSGFHRPGMYS